MDYFQLYIKSTYKDQILAQQWQVREGLLCELHTWEFSEVCRLYQTDGIVSSDLLVNV